ncbi:PKD domain-containing protein [Flammeovirga sp. SubArs3]|uniref:PKD domain-containing protein n=1 Tax=Flammeovirga sp. SubArs3 TaxID=2995316 RepID=UPI00248C7618|nr:PKD domain-containing protein [Flammeovirga sp. SubArs3]
MKKLNFVNWLILGIIAFAFGACDDNETTVTGPTGTLTYTQAEGADYEVTFTIENPVDVLSYSFDFGDGSTANSGETSVTHTYVETGDFDVVVTLNSASDQAQLKTTVTVTTIDVSGICNSEYYTLLTGGCVNDGPGEGKTWKLSNAYGSHGVGPADGEEAVWWNSEYDHWNGNNGEGFAMPETMESRFTFGVVPNTMAVSATHQINNWQTDGEATPFHDYQATYGGESSYGYSITEEEGKMYLNIANGGYMAYYQEVDGATPTKYEIVTLTETELYVRYLNVLNYNDGEDKNYRYLRYVQEDVVEEAPEEVVKDLEYRAISASFNGTMDATVGDETIAFINEADIVTAFVADPTDDGVQVLSYTKNGTVDDVQVTLNHRMDLSTNNTFKLKVYFPSSNDYETVDDSAEDWTDSEGKLASMVNLKLYDTKMGGNAWHTEATVRVSDDTRDEWVELEFSYDGLEVTNRNDQSIVWEDAAESDTYDKIIIQIGGEGHKRSGTFYIKDFELVENAVN